MDNVTAGKNMVGWLFEETPAKKQEVIQKRETSFNKDNILSIKEQVILLFY